MATELPVSIDLSHHFNVHSKLRQSSPLKMMFQYMDLDGMVSFAGGLPHPSLFPFEDASLSVYPASVTIDPAHPDKPTGELKDIKIKKRPAPNDVANLTAALQYGPIKGMPALCAWVRAFTKTVFQPAYSNFEVLLNTGNTDAWCKVVRLLCEPGDFIICEEHTFPSAQALWIPMGCKAVPIKMDGRGMRADNLDRTLSEWDAVYPNEKRPRLLYVVPVGSNPTGATMDGERRKEIYEVCVKHDVIICEDDPYSFLQFAKYEVGVPSTTSSPEKSSPEEFLNTLAPSFLKYDYQGRVIRLETFSKTLAPGNRLGYFVTNHQFSQRLTMASEVEIQAPGGWSQAIVLTLLTEWGHLGYIQWLSTLRDQYKIRRDWMCDAIATEFDLKPASDASLPGAVEGLIAFSKTKEPTALFSFVPPAAGMFVWARFYFSHSPRFLELQADSSCADPEQTYEDELWAALAKDLVLMTPGSYYTPWQGDAKSTTKLRGGEPGIGHFRLAFSMTTKEEMQLGIKRMAKVLLNSWGLLAQ